MNRQRERFILFIAITFCLAGICTILSSPSFFVKRELQEKTTKPIPQTSRTTTSVEPEKTDKTTVPTTSAPYDGTTSPIAIITTASPSENDPCSPNPCLNHGSCSVNVNAILGYSCFCRDYYTGHNCETCPSYCKEKWVIRYIQQPEKDIHYREMKAHCANRAGENDSDTGYPAFFRSNFDYKQYKRNNTDGRREYLGLS